MTANCIKFINDSIITAKGTGSISTLSFDLDITVAPITKDNPLALLYAFRRPIRFEAMAGRFTDHIGWSKFGGIHLKRISLMRANWCAGIVFSLIQAISSVSISAQESIDDILSIIDACDIMAAHPDDPLRVAPGVPDADMVPRLARKACESALTSSDDVARHAFQLGRVLLEQDEREAALAQFHTAAEAGSAIALMFLGDSEQFGWVAEPNADNALEYYQQAGTLGMPTSDLSVEQVTFDASIFTTGLMLAPLARKQIAKAVRYARQDLARAYLYAFALELAQDCGAFLRPQAVAALQAYRFPPGWSAAQEENDEEMGLQDVLATYDVEVLVDRHGCSGVVIETIAGSFNDVMLKLAN